MSIYTKNCTECGSELHIDESADVAFCDCGAVFDVQMQVNSEGSPYMTIEFMGEEGGSQAQGIQDNDRLRKVQGSEEADGAFPNQ